jgi:hypothetical protein
MLVLCILLKVILSQILYRVGRLAAVCIERQPKLIVVCVVGNEIQKQEEVPRYKRFVTIEMNSRYDSAVVYVRIQHSA